MIKKNIAFILLCLMLLLMPREGRAAAMTDYCVVPPYVIQNVPPNIMLLADNSLSMYNYAYKCLSSTIVSGGSSTSCQTTMTIGSTAGLKVGDPIRTWEASYCTGSSANQSWYPPVSSTLNNVITDVNHKTKQITVQYCTCAANGAPIVKQGCTYIPINNSPSYVDSYDPNASYYGNFNQLSWYSYGSNKFTPSAKKAARAKLSTEWDGNFLNWAVMTRIDVLRRVLTGGRNTASVLTVDMPDSTADSLYGPYQRYVPLAYNYADTSSAGIKYTASATDSGKRMIGLQTSGSSAFIVGITNAAFTNTAYSTYSWPTGSSAPNKLTPSAVQNTTVEGVLQDVVSDKARIGLTFYDSGTNEGGVVQTSVAGTSLSAVVNQINNPTNFGGATPLAESLFTIAGYFSQLAKYTTGTIISTGASGNGPLYKTGNYTNNATNDPMNYGTGGSPLYPECAKNYVIIITDGEPCADGNLPTRLLNYAINNSPFNCGTPNGVSNCPSISNSTGGENYEFAAQSIPGGSLCSPGGNVAGLEDVALWAHTTDLRDAAVGSAVINGVQNLNIYVISAFGKGSTLLRYTAINGGFEDSNGNGKPDLQSEWDSNHDGEPDTFYEADEGDELEQSLRSALTNILKRAASGTAASVLASGEGSGANLVQAVFYPRRRFGNDVIMWNGALQNFWYYIDPHFSNSNIREDTDKDGVFNLYNDNVLQLFFNTTSQQTMANLFVDTNGDGEPDVAANPPTKKLEDLSYIWEAGKKLFERNLNTDPRTIWTNLSAPGTTNPPFTAFTNATADATAIAPYMNLTDLNANGSKVDEAKNVIDYLHGVPVFVDDGSGNNQYRERTVNIDGVEGVWKLGDVLNSTPRILSWVPLNHYYTVYGDNTYMKYYSDIGSVAAADASSRYKNRGYVFAGGNDGMLHAVKLGKLEQSWSGQDTQHELARLTGTNMGKEIWAFVPKGALPYLQYFPDRDYCHIFTVDLSPFIFDASINKYSSCSASDYSECARKQDGTDNSWRTVLIGGMRLGGGCRTSTSTCTDCVKVPVKVGSEDVGYSSYFAMDITDPENPSLMWEFSNDALGTSMSGPAVIRINSKDSSGVPDKQSNGKWFAVFSSGPTGPIDTINHQFMGKSDQNLKLFVVDLKTGALARTIDTGVALGFAGSTFNVTHDSDLDYSDDVVYLGYTYKDTAAGTWTKGGVGRLLTIDFSNAFNYETSDTTKWTFTKVIDAIEPITSAIAPLQGNAQAGVSYNKMWLYFGSGRYFYSIPSDPVDDLSGQRYLYGIKDKCFTGVSTLNSHDPGIYASTCPAAIATRTGLDNVDSAPADASLTNGWYLTLYPAGMYNSLNYAAERVITDPIATAAGITYFTTYMPYNTQCGIGGKSYIWALDSTTGWSAASGLKGTALIQVSTGSIEKVDLSKAFTDRNNRRSTGIEGMPPTAQGFSLFTQPAPRKKIIQTIER